MDLPVQQFRTKAEQAFLDMFEAAGKALPGGGYWSMPKLSMPGAVLVGDAGGQLADRRHLRRLEPVLLCKSYIG